MELYAVKFGESTFYYKYIYRDMGNSEEVTNISWSYYIAKFNDKIIYIDTGFRDKTTASKWGITFTDVDNELGMIINNKVSADVVFITHSHFDHIENLDLVDNPTIIISKIDYDFVINNCSYSIKEKLLQCNTVTVEDEYTYENLFRFKVIGGHSAGSSVIYFTNDNKDYVITGDECYWCDNLKSNRPIGNYSNTEKNEEFLSKAHKQELVPLPFHDLKIFEEHSAISKNIVRII